MSWLRFGFVTSWFSSAILSHKCHSMRTFCSSVLAVFSARLNFWLFYLWYYFRICSQSKSLLEMIRLDSKWLRISRSLERIRFLEDGIGHRTRLCPNLDKCAPERLCDDVDVFERIARTSVVSVPCPILLKQSLHQVWSLEMVWFTIILVDEILCYLR